MFTEDTLEAWRKREIGAVFDSSPLIYLTKIGVLDYALKVYKEVYIPDSVKREVIDRGIELCKPDACILNEYVKNERIRCEKIKNVEICTVLSRNPQIHKADVEAICLAEEVGCILVVDDPKAIEIARLRRVKIEPTLTVILICYAVDYIDFKKAEHAYRELLKTQFRVKAQVYERALELLEIIRDVKVHGRT